MTDKRPDFTIRKVHTPTEQEKKPLDKFLMKMNSITAFVAPTNSGKTNLIVNLLNRKQMYRKRFDYIVLISSTYHIDNMWVKAKGIDEVFEAYDDEILLHIIEEQKHSLQKEGREKTPNVLVILDDVIDTLPKNSSALNSLSMRLRHYKVTCWITTQKFNRLPTTMRNQIQYYILFRAASKNVKERESIAGEVGSMVNEKAFLKLWESVGDNNYNFMVVNVRNPEKRMFQREFQAYLKPAEPKEENSDTDKENGE